MSYFNKYPAKPAAPANRPRSDDEQPATLTESAPRAASYFTSYACKSEHQFVNNPDGTRDANTRCAGCLKTIGQLFELKCAAAVDVTNNHARVHELIMEKLDMQAQIKALQESVKELMESKKTESA